MRSGTVATAFVAAGVEKSDKNDVEVIAPSMKPCSWILMIIRCRQNAEAPSSPNHACRSCHRHPSGLQAPISTWQRSWALRAGHTTGVWARRRRRRWRRCGRLAMIHKYMQIGQCQAQVKTTCCRTSSFAPTTTVKESARPEGDEMWPCHRRCHTEGHTDPNCKSTVTEKAANLSEPSPRVVGRRVRALQRKPVKITLEACIPALSDSASRAWSSAVMRT